MYKRFSEMPAKSVYCQIVEDTIAYVKDISDRNDDPIYPYILNQLKDIYREVIINNSICEPEDVYDRYDIGAIGVRYFDENDEMHERLCDIFYGAVHYKELK